MSYIMKNSEFYRSYTPSDIPTDKNDRPIREGDTIKIFDFTDYNGKEHYSYKYVKGVTSISEVEVKPDAIARSNHYYEIDNLDSCRGISFMSLDGKKHQNIEIVQGHYAYQDYEDRKKVLRNVEK